MPKKDDDRLQMRIENKLSNIGMRAPCRVMVDVFNGTVKLKGKVQYAYQKRAAIVAARSMDGVRSVIDDMKVEPPVRNWEEGQAAPGEAEGEEAPPE